MMNALILFGTPVLVGYVLYKVLTYDWGNHAQDVRDMGDDMF